MTDLVNLIERKEAVVGVVGLGYVGLPLVREFVRSGFRVLGFDINARVVETLNAGRSIIRHIPSELIAKLRRENRFEGTCDFSRLTEPDCILICVPTPLTPTQDPDLSFVESSARQIAATLRKGQLVVLESTTYPGTTEEFVKPLLDAKGLVCGSDYFLAYSPEREDPGNPIFTTGTIPKIVGGMDEASSRAACALYQTAVVKVVPVSHCRVAEAAKILENIYRSVNIALVNELKLLFDRMDIDVWEVIEAASTKPFGFHAFYPGPGLGGHCIPIDPFYLAWKAREVGKPTRFIELAGEVNSSMPEHVVTRVAEALNAHRKPVNGSRVLMLGVAYKKDVDDVRESPALEIVEMLEARGALVDYHDPYVASVGPVRKFPHLKKSSVELTETRLEASDCVLIVTDHSGLDYAWVVEHSPLVVDTRNATRNVREGRRKIFKA